MREYGGVPRQVRPSFQKDTVASAFRSNQLDGWRGCANMKPRHAALLALVGWYLMVPIKNHLDAPMRYWSLFENYPSTKECSEAQAALLKESKDPDSKIHRFTDEIAMSECIASHDPRLKEK
ncbi:MAG: hypothetical protein WBQ86_22380 [Candidatus Binatus sp.]